MYSQYNREMPNNQDNHHSGKGAEQLKCEKSDTTGGTFTGFLAIFLSIASRHCVCLLHGSGERGYLDS